MLKRSYRTVLLACLAVGCNDMTSAPGRLGNGDELRPAFAVRVHTVSVKPASSTINVGQTVQLTASSKPAKKAVYVWSTSNSAVATVSATGLVTGLAAGTATITATSEGKSGTASVTVSAAPPGGTTVTLVGAGDIASCSSSGDEATAALVDTMPGTVFTAGDNAYSDGSALNFTNCYQPSWGKFKVRTRPSPGNHDYHISGAADYYAYYGSNAGPAGRGYYSYNLGAWHIISLNSEVGMTAGSAQETWLRQDLAGSTAKCTLAYWHKPRWSSGTQHGSNSAAQAVWQALYDYGADVVVQGHEHNYERFAPKNGSGALDPSFGIRSFVAGTGGVGHYNDKGTAVLGSEVFNGTTWGVLKLTLGQTSYSWRFVPVAGGTFTDAGIGQCH
jgi:Big-like domain-containing protein/calcineurin-like phosphoesterase family protein